MSRLPKVDKKPKNNKDNKFRWVDSQWEKLLTRQKELQDRMLELEIENAELRDKLIRYGEDPNQLSFDFEINKISDNDFEVKKPMIYESPDGGKTITARKAGSSVKKTISRMDIIGQNGNDGLHYDETDAVKFVEDKYPETTKEFRRLQQEQYRVFCEKQMDYGSE